MTPADQKRAPRSAPCAQANRVEISGPIGRPPSPAWRRVRRQARLPNAQPRHAPGHNALGAQTMPARTAPRCLCAQCCCRGRASRPAWGRTPPRRAGWQCPAFAWRFLPSHEPARCAGERHCPNARKHSAFRTQTEGGCGAIRFETRSAQACLCEAGAWRAPGALSPRWCRAQGGTSCAARHPNLGACAPIRSGRRTVVKAAQVGFQGCPPHRA